MDEVRITNDFEISITVLRDCWGLSFVKRYVSCPFEIHLKMVKIFKPVYFLKLRF